MSGIYIKNVELPPKGSHVICLLTWDGAFWKLGYKDENWAEEEDMYIGEAIPVPDHGRLGDLDAFWDRLKNTKSVLGFGTAKEYQIYDMGFLAGFRAAAVKILEMPAVIPADRSKE